MGLQINSYCYSYGTLQSLRRFALKVEGNKKLLTCSDYGMELGSFCGKCVYCALDGKITPTMKKLVTSFYEFIDHSDCDGGYVSFSKFGIRKLPKGFDLTFWGNLDELKKEVEVLNEHKEDLDPELISSFEDFYDDVFMSEYVLTFE